MSEAPVLRPNAQILDEACAWFVEFNEGEVSIESREGFAVWLKASPEHVRAYLEILPAWEAGRVLPGRLTVDELVAMGRAAPPNVSRICMVDDWQNAARGRASTTRPARSPAEAVVMSAWTLGGILRWDRAGICLRRA